MDQLPRNREYENRPSHITSEVLPYNSDNFCTLVQIEPEFIILHDHNTSNIQYFVELPKGVNLRLQFKKNEHGVTPSYFSCKLNKIIELEFSEENIKQVSNKLHELESRLSNTIDEELLRLLKSEKADIFAVIETGNENENRYLVKKIDGIITLYKAQHAKPILENSSGIYAIEDIIQRSKVDPTEERDISLESVIPVSNEPNVKKQNRFLALYGLDREFQEITHNPNNIHGFFKIVTSRPIPVALDNKSRARYVIRFVNTILSIFSSGFIVGKLLTVLMTLLALNFAEYAQNKKGYKSVFAGIGATIAYFIAVALACLSTVTSTNSPLANLKNTDTTLPRNLIKFADRFAQVIRIITQVFFALTCLAVILLSTGGSVITLLIASQSWINVAIIGIFISFTSTLIMTSSALITSIYIMSAIFFSVWAFFAARALGAFIDRKFREAIYNYAFAKMIKRKHPDLNLEKASFRSMSEREITEKDLDQEHLDNTLINEMLTQVRKLHDMKKYYEARKYIQDTILSNVIKEYHLDEMKTKEKIFTLSAEIKSKLEYELGSKSQEMLFYDFNKFMGSIFFNYQAFKRSIKYPIWDKILTILSGNRKAVLNSTIPNKEFLSFIKTFQEKNGTENIALFLLNYVVENQSRLPEQEGEMIETYKRYKIEKEQGKKTAIPNDVMTITLSLYIANHPNGKLFKKELKDLFKNRDVEISSELHPYIQFVEDWQSVFMCVDTSSEDPPGISLIFVQNSPQCFKL